MIDLSKQYVFSNGGVIEAPDEWLNSITERGFVSDNYDDVFNGKYVILNDEQKNYYDLHPDYDMVDIFNLTSPTEERLNEMYEQKKEAVRSIRQSMYEKYSDHLYIEYQKDLALGNVEKAEAVKQQWLTVVQEIEKQYPYPTK